MQTADGSTVEEETAVVESASEAGSADEADASGRPEPEPEPDPEPEDANANEQGSGAEPLSDEEHLRAVAALVFASPEPISARKLAALLAGGNGSGEVARATAALEAIREKLLACGLPLELRSIAGGWQILTTPDSSEVVKRLFQDRKAEKISPAALETLAVVAYRQPVTKAEIEAIRGVQVSPILRSLVDRDLVRVTGRADVPGHPLQYGTTKTFLDRFGLAGIEDLPRDSELTR